MFSSALKALSSNISANYTLSPQPTCTAGPWQIFDAKRKTSGKAASVFVFSPKILEAPGNSHGSLGGRGNAGVSLKRAHEEVVERLRREASSLARLRHPSILELVEPLEETRNGGLMFATEPVTASLAGVLAEKDEQERSGGVGGRGSRYVVEEADGTRRRRELEIDELEIQKGLLQLGKGLEFLHESAGLVHANLTPDAVLINAKGDWKLSGLAYCGPHESSTAASSLTPINLHEALTHDPRLPRSVQLNVDYTSPDFVLDNTLAPSADIFSLGLLVVALYNKPHTSPLSTSGSLSSYKRLFASSSTTPSQANNFLVPEDQPLPPKLGSELLSRLLARRPAQRLSAREFQEASYFDNILVSTMRFLDSLPAKTAQEKASFMRGLPRILPQFPKTVLERKVLPALLEEMKDREALAPILTNVFVMIKAMPTGKRAFAEKVVPRLREVFLPVKGTKPAAATTGSEERDTSREAGLMVLLENVSVICANCPSKEFEETILPIILLGLEAPTHGVVDAALSTLPQVLRMLNFGTMKHDLFPVVAAVFSKTSSLAIKIRGLEAFYTLCGGSSTTSDTEQDDLNGIGVSDQKGSPSSAILDKHTIQDTVVPLLKGIKTKEPGVMMAALRVFRQVGEVADTDFLAMDVLPVLWSMSLGPLLDLQQFQAFMALIKSLSTRIERAQTRKLQELGSGSSSAVAGVRKMQRSANGAAGMNGMHSGEEADFETLVSGRKPSASVAVNGGDDLMNDWSGSAAQRPAVSTSHQPTSNSNAPTFSWQTPSPTVAHTVAAQTRQRSALGLQQQRVAIGAIGRTVTPDQSLSSFAALTPASQYSQPLQPTRAGTSMSTTSSIPLRPAQAPQALDWSSATTNNASTWASQRPTTNAAPSTTGSFALPPPPAISNGTSAVRTPALPQQQPKVTGGLDKYESLL